MQESTFHLGLQLAIVVGQLLGFRSVHIAVAFPCDLNRVDSIKTRKYFFKFVRSGRFELIFHYFNNAHAYEPAFTSRRAKIVLNY